MISGISAETKNALKNGDLPKNYRINVLKADGTVDFTIDNNTLVSESVKLDERMCTGDYLKFGLCEGSSLEFKYFDHPSILGRQLQIFVDVYNNFAVPTSYESIPMGFYTVKECSRQAETDIRQVTAYNKLQSSYLDAKATTEVQEIISAGEPGRDIGVSNYYLMNQLLDGYGIDNRPPQIDTMNSFNEANVSFEELLDGNGYLGNERIYFLLSKDDGYLSEYVGAFAVQRKSILSTKMIVDSNNVITNNNDFLPIGYHYVSFNPEIAGTIKNTINGVFSNYQDGEYTYYVQPYKFNDVSAVGTKIKLRDFLALIDIDEENINPLAPTDNNMNGTISHLDSMFKGLVALDNDYMSVGSRIVYAMQLKRVAANEYSRDYRYYQLITPTNRHETKLLYVPATVAADYRACNSIRLVLPSAIYWTDDRYSIEDGNTPDNWYLKQAFPWHENGYDFQLESKFKATTDIENYVWTSSRAENLQDVTARDLQSSIFEINCQFGQLDRVTDLFSGVELTQGQPQEIITKDMYSKLWADEGNVHSWRNLIITYKGMVDGQEKQLTLQRQVNADGTDDYNCSDNWLFNNLVWTAEQVGAYADAMKTKMQNITWFPFEEWGAGLPYVETGDKVGITFGSQIYDSYVLQRQLNGIQNLQDTYINGTLDIF